MNTRIQNSPQRTKQHGPKRSCPNTEIYSKQYRTWPLKVLTYSICCCCDISCFFISLVDFFLLNACYKSTKTPPRCDTSKQLTGIRMQGTMDRGLATPCSLRRFREAVDDGTTATPRKPSGLDSLLPLTSSEIFTHKHCPRTYRPRGGGVPHKVSKPPSENVCRLHEGSQINRHNPKCVTTGSSILLFGLKGSIWLNRAID